MGLKKLLKKISCKIFFCAGSKCSYNEKGKGKFRLEEMEDADLDFDERSRKRSRAIEKVGDTAPF